MLTPPERHRYRRHLQLAEIGEAGQLRLRAARVLVVGAGGLGCPVLQYLAAAGVGTLGIADADQVELSNLQRQVLYGPADVGQPKAETAARAVQRLNPLVACEIHSLRVDRSNVCTLVAAYDAVVDGTDNFATRYLLNDACVSLGKPLISGAIYKFEGQVSVFNYRGGPTYRCLFPAPPGPTEAPNCDTTGVLGVLPGLVGTAQATETLKVLLDLGEVLSGRLWVIDALTFQSRALRFPRHPERSLINLDTANPTDYTDAMCPPAVAPISVAELRRLLHSAAPPFLLDVREPDEYAAGHLPGATLVPLGLLAENAATIPQHQTVVVYCRSGARSARAVAQLQTDFGYTNLLNLEGGISACDADLLGA
ncbi:molybdopterin-synthase adenylyltransferase MoeB [Hymenobacter busanensis]|uniref:Molybdopterin-synthase adenylyltransferase n=1 Tax=Hymenobacter busanensis TaxID=2607656 RepID=A0A7L4ZV90_9BACT|nr:molybdopterin-synthase adenylyltransferase MoeB [Hymenobacter busanensis]KAA9327540.1 molybdopterin-synthase adenylyltransferase MoeB [Hymenobacter busanensis]QHJ06122.1 molybdopterin-synthase adenylyltransferase MoeB [Hymenobacter busanensis]